MELPEECWELIFKSLDHHRYYESLSLISSSFFSITNILRHTLTITDQTVPFVPRLLRRFPNLKTVRFHAFRGDLDLVLIRVSLSELDLESVDVSGSVSAFSGKGMMELGLKMRNLRELNCSRIRDLGDSDLMVIGNCFPFLQHLDISYPVTSCPITDSGFISLISKLKRLQKINLSGNQFITNTSLVSLSQNCLFLRQVVVRDCDFITPYGISFLIRDSRNLESISVTGIGIPPVQFCFEESLVFARVLCELDLRGSFLSDDSLCLMAEANFPLKKLVLSNSYCFTFDGISYLLSKYQSLVHLDLEGSSFLTDNSIMELCKYIQSLTFINLSFCSKLTGLAFLAIMENCSLLNCFKMEGTNLGVEELSMEIKFRSRVKFMYLAGNNNLSDEFIKRIACVCPGLEMLNVSQCPCVTEDGILEILKNCFEVRYLDISRCVGIKNLVLNFEVPKLEALLAHRIQIDDEDLAMIGKRCGGLLCLELQGCLNVTSNGVKEVVQNCMRLREVNLKWCDAGADFLTWMVCTRPSLRKIIPPHGFILTKSQSNFFLRHGCVIFPDGQFDNATDSLHYLI